MQISAQRLFEQELRFLKFCYDMHSVRFWDMNEIDNMILTSYLYAKCNTKNDNRQYH